MLVGLIFIAVVVIGLIALIVLAERSLRSQRNSGIRRTPEEDRHVGHAISAMSRSAGGSGGP